MNYRNSKTLSMWFQNKSFVWSLIACYVTLIYSTLYIMRPIINFLKMILRGYFNLGIAIIFLIILSFVLVHIISNRERYSVSQYLWFSLISCLYGLIIYVVDIPEEQAHFIEYGILSGLIYIALTHDMNNNVYVYFLSAFIVFVFGAIDEVIQWILPNREFDIRDILINGIAGILVQLLIAMVISKRKVVLISHEKDYV
ncbi:MAG: VanZ family protein [Candidatus Scalinduaceae bacterium]